MIVKTIMNTILAAAEQVDTINWTFVKINRYHNVKKNTSNHSSYDIFSVAIFLFFARR